MVDVGAFRPPLIAVTKEDHVFFRDTDDRKRRDSFTDTNLSAVAAEAVAVCYKDDADCASGADICLKYAAKQTDLIVLVRHDHQNVMVCIDGVSRNVGEIVRECIKRRFVQYGGLCFRQGGAARIRRHSDCTGTEHCKKQRRGAAHQQGNDKIQSAHVLIILTVRVACNGVKVCYTETERE